MHGWFTYGDDVLGTKLIYAKETEDYENDVKEICQDGSPHEPQEVKHLAFDDGKLQRENQKLLLVLVIKWSLNRGEGISNYYHNIKTKNSKKFIIKML